MTDRLVDFIVELNKDPQLVENYKISPRQIAEDYGLDSDDVKMLEDNDQEAIMKRCDKKGVEIKGMIMLEETY
ncbi:MAG: hypothetical protein HRT38_07980 [Alteromonadaceae bacterium]|nr:hypothetical protein [Alteromonadaceae bacterium]